MSERQIERELRSVREQGIPGSFARTAGQFSLAGAQPKIALLEENGVWSRPNGRIPTNRILKPPTGDFEGFAENEHFCLGLAGMLELGAARSTVRTFGAETAIVVERFDRRFDGAHYTRIHQEDCCQALGVPPQRKYQSEGGPGTTDIISLLRDNSTKPDEDLERFIGATALNWIIGATDAHAKNYALLLGSRAVRLAPLYDILSYLPYTDHRLHRVKLAMKLGGEYLLRAVARKHWTRFAAENRLGEQRVRTAVERVLERLPDAIEQVTHRAIADGLHENTITALRDQLIRRRDHCRELMSNATTTIQPDLQDN